MNGLVGRMAMGLSLLWFCGPLFAQQVCPPGTVCEMPPMVVIAQAAQPAEVVSVVADSPHVRCMINGSCGSGTICGSDGNGSYVVTNAHVTGTALGKSVIVDVIVGNGGKRTNGRTVMTGYSDSRMVDFSIVFVEGLSSKRYMPMLKTEPSAAPYETIGSPKCVWPLVRKAFNSPRNYADGLITGSPNAIGGQSGSAIYNTQGQQIALLTWSISGRCAGQKTAKLWQVATERNLQLAELRPEGLSELADGPGDGDRPETTEGIQGCCGLFEMADDSPTYEHVRPDTKSQLAFVVGNAMEDLPIWVGPPKPPVEPPGNGDCMEVSAKERELIEFLRAQMGEETGLIGGGPNQRAIDYVKLIGLIMEIIRLIQEGRAG